MDNAVVPDWVHLLPMGKFGGADGRGPWTVANALAVIAASMAQGRLPVDENHATDLAAPAGQPSPARGWIVEMQARPDGIWGRVEWNETGRTMLAARTYRSISPVFIHSPNGAVTQILRAALTNVPNLLQLKALNMSTLDRELDGSKDVKPTEVERDIARRMNIDPIKLAQMRAQREAQQMPDDAARIREFERLTTARNPTAPASDARRTADFQRSLQAAGLSDGKATPTVLEREIARRGNIDPDRLAQARADREAKERQEVLERWDGYINPGGPPNRAYELTALDSEACRKLGIDAQQFLAWKRDPTNAARPRGMPIDPYASQRLP